MPDAQRAWEREPCFTSGVPLCVVSGRKAGREEGGRRCESWGCRVSRVILDMCGHMLVTVTLKIPQTNEVKAYYRCSRRENSHWEGRPLRSPPWVAVPSWVSRAAPTIPLVFPWAPRQGPPWVLCPYLTRAWEGSPAVAGPRGRAAAITFMLEGGFGEVVLEPRAGSRVRCLGVGRLPTGGPGVCIGLHPKQRDSFGSEGLSPLPGQGGGWWLYT